MLLGGILTEFAGWEWIFFVNVPIGVLALFFVRRFVRESRSEGIARSFDAGGAFRSLEPHGARLRADPGEPEGLGLGQTMACCSSRQR